MKKSKKLPRLTQHQVIQLTGFDLLIGQSYQEGFFRLEEPSIDTIKQCPKCQITGLTKWPLARQINAYGNNITQYRTIYECLSCKHEHFAVESQIADYPIKSPKLNKFQLTALLTLAKEKGFL